MNVENVTNVKSVWTPAELIAESAEIIAAMAAQDDRRRRFRAAFDSCWRS